MRRVNRGAGVNWLEQAKAWERRVLSDTMPFARYTDAGPGFAPCRLFLLSLWQSGAIEVLARSAPTHPLSIVIGRNSERRDRILCEIAARIKGQMS
jgi:hypothetical protein